MSALRSSARPVPAFFVERYWPGVTLEAFTDAVGRLEKCIDVLRADGTGIQTVTATFVPEDEAAYWVIEGPSRGSLEVAFGRAGVPIDRIVSAVEVRKGRGAQGPARPGSRSADSNTGDA